MKPPKFLLCGVDVSAKDIAVALANKLARTVWAVWTKQENYQSFPRRTGGNA